MPDRRDLGRFILSAMTLPDIFTNATHFVSDSYKLSFLIRRNTPHITTKCVKEQQTFHKPNLNNFINEFERIHQELQKSELEHR